MCVCETRRRPKAPKQRSNAMRQARDKQHSSSGAATAQQQRPEGLPKLVHHINPLILRPRRIRSACAGSRDTTSKRQSCKTCTLESDTRGALMNDEWLATTQSCASVKVSQVCLAEKVRHSRRTTPRVPRERSMSLGDE